MKKKNYTLIVLTGVIGIIVILVGAWVLNELQTSFNTEAKNENSRPENIKFYSVYPENELGAKIMKNIVDEFNRSQNNIFVEGNTGVSVEQQLVSIMSGNTPDVGYTYWPDALRWAQNGALEPLAPFISKNNFSIEDFLTATINVCKYNGDIYAIPFYVQTMALYYNKDILNEAGYDKPPKTMEEFKVMAKKLTIVDEKKEIETMGFLPDFPWIDNVLWPILFGAEFYDVNKNEVTTISQEYIDAIEFQNWFYQEWGWNSISKFRLKFGSDEQEPFYNGKLAMIMGGEWVSRDISQYAPDLNYGMCAFPYPENRPDLENSSLISPGVIYMSSESGHKDAAWEFISYLASTESMLKFANEYKSLMARKSVITNSQINNDPKLKLLSELALNKNTRSFPPLPIVDEYLANLAEQTELVFKQKKTSLEAMEYVKSKIDPLLKNEN